MYFEKLMSFFAVVLNVLENTKWLDGVEQTGVGWMYQYFFEVKIVVHPVICLP